jgi:nicotinamidase-related amidase
MSFPNTAVLLIDPYNEFLHPDGKLHFKVSTSLAETNTITHLKELVAGARANKIPIFYCFHQQIHAKSYEHWNHMTNAQKESERRMVFEENTFGTKIFEGLEPGEGDVVVSKHWSWRFVFFVYP